MRIHQFITTRMFISLFIVYSVVSWMLFIATAREMWGGLIYLVFGLPFYGACLILFVGVRFLRPRGNCVVYSRWFLYPILFLQTSIMALNYTAPTLDVRVRFELVPMYLVLLSLFVLTVALARVPSEVGNSEKVSTLWPPFVVDGLVIVGLAAIMVVVGLAQPHIGAWKCQQAAARTLHVPADQCRAPEIYVMNADASGLTRLTTTGLNANPAWSPDGQRIAFVSSGDVYVMEADGSNQIQLTSLAGNEYNPAWSPNGAQIIFESKGDKNIAGQADLDGIYIVQTNGSRLSRLVHQGTYPAWSPDGQQVVFSVNRDTDARICVVLADGSATRCVITISGYTANPTWSPDGQQIVFTVDQGGPELYRMNADGSGLTRLTSDGGRNPRWSPTDQQILFETDRSNRTETALCVLRLDGSHETCVTTYPIEDSEPMWSPDGRQIAFLAPWEESRAMYVVNSDGSGRTRLVWNSMMSTPVWSPDGRRIAFSG